MAQVIEENGELVIRLSLREKIFALHGNPRAKTVDLIATTESENAWSKGSCAVFVHLEPEFLTSCCWALCDLRAEKISRRYTSVDPCESMSLKRVSLSAG